MIIIKLALALFFIPVLVAFIALNIAIAATAANDERREMGR